MPTSISDRAMLVLGIGLDHSILACCSSPVAACCAVLPCCQPLHIQRLVIAMQQNVCFWQAFGAQHKIQPSQHPPLWNLLHTAPVPLPTHPPCIAVSLPFLQLLPSDPAGRAAARLMIQRFSDKAVPAFYRMLVQQDKAVQAAAATVLDAELQWLVDNMHPQGPFAMGQQLSLVDCAIAPFLIRLFVLEHYRCADTAQLAMVQLQVC